MKRHCLAVILLTSLGAIEVSADVPPVRPMPWGQQVHLAGPDEEWWSGPAAGVIGGSVGGTVGIVGAVFGICAGAGVARRFVLGLALAMIVFGVLVLLGGIAAVTGGQPYHVYYPLLLIGILTTGVFGCNFPFVKRRYDQVDIQKTHSMDT